jgi:hypothetical protein
MNTQLHGDNEPRGFGAIEGAMWAIVFTAFAALIVAAIIFALHRSAPASPEPAIAPSPPMARQLAGGTLTGEVTP